MPFRSDKLRQRLALALTATVVTSLGRPDAVAHGETLSGAQCTSEVLPGARDSLTTTLLGRATRDTIEAGAGVVHGTMWMGSRRAIYGQVVRVDSMLGPGGRSRPPSTDCATIDRGTRCSLGEQPWLWDRRLATERVVDDSRLVRTLLAPTAAGIYLGIGSANVRCILCNEVFLCLRAVHCGASRRVQGPDRSQTRREPLDDSGRGLRPVRRVTKRRTDNRLARERAPARLGPRESECANEVSG